ncbi:cellulase family glycosylhydrolase [Mycobacterium yunnanensis]|uniref:Cellulase family glycosylhydrolase n=1 Tax=Mycobacterium yunnanensis TaxID=368477 RepID=A0A9X3C0V1_9MYCO|nr:cellulase family glycosylhydrolase [Mycobacterium yunnanensis]MCV7419856.1 cellulase family glycosylhydrolase [Mycobacterium yunnanensis]
MWQSNTQGDQPAFAKYLVVGMATVAVSAFGAAAMTPGLRTVSTDVAETAAIDPSNTTVGIADSDIYFESHAQIDAALDEMQAMGVNTVRIGIPWAGVNPIPGYYDWSQSDYLINAADQRGMGILAVITTTPGYQQNGSGVYSAPNDPAAFGQFAGLAAQRYAGKVGAYEIWNEPNAAPFYGPAPDPAGYTELLKAAYPTIKAADPNATVIGGVVGSTVTYQNLTLDPVTFVDQMYQAGAQGYFDALSFHPYQYTMPFSQGGAYPTSPINQLDDIHDLMVANGDGGKLIWASEYGEPTSVASEAQQADYLRDMLTTWRTIGYTGPAFVYTLQDTDSSSTDPEATFGLIRSDGTWKPAAYVIQELAQSQTTTPELARMALALPQADTAAPADLAALQAIAGPTDTTTDPQLASATTQMAATAPTATVTDPAAPAVVQPAVASPVIAQPVLATPVLATPTLAEPTVVTPTTTQATPVTQPATVVTQPAAVAPQPATVATQPTPAVTQPVSTSPTLAAPTLVTPTVVQPTVAEPTIAVAPTEPTSIPSPTLSPSTVTAPSPSKSTTSGTTTGTASGTTTGTTTGTTSGATAGSTGTTSGSASTGGSTKTRTTADQPKKARTR